MVGSLQFLLLAIVKASGLSSRWLLGNLLVLTYLEAESKTHTVFCSFFCIFTQLFLLFLGLSLFSCPTCPRKERGFNTTQAKSQYTSTGQLHDIEIQSITPTKPIRQRTHRGLRITHVPHTHWHQYRPRRMLTLFPTQFLQKSPPEPEWSLPLHLLAC